jgi:hypothetical protein
MDGRYFDSITRGLVQQAPRRRLLVGLAVGALAIVAGDPIGAVKRRKRKGNDGNGDDPTSSLPPGTLAGGIWEKTMDICHFDPDAGKFTVMTVPLPSVSDYFNQGDTPYVDCCDSSECGVLPCYSPTGCIEGACMYDPVPGQACALDDGTTGVCDEDGACVVGVPSGY